MSPTGDFLATAHVNYLGLFLWANKTLFSHVSLRTINPEAEVPLLDLPTSMQNDNDALQDRIEQLALDVGEVLDADYNSPVQLSNELVTMSQLAAARWQNLLNIDIVKKRNKPRAPLKVPKQAPFFLPTLAGIDMKFDMTNVRMDEGNTKLLIPDNFLNLTSFGKVLDDSRTSGDLDRCAVHLMALGPSMVDFEIKSLQPDAGTGNVALMLQFLRMITFMLDTNLNFELAQTYLGVFLKAHGMHMHQQLREYLGVVEAAQLRGWAAIEDKLLYGLGVVSALRNFSN